MKKILMRLLPGEWFYVDHLTSSAQSLLTRLGAALLGLIAAGIALGLLNTGNWTDVIAGALFAWSTSFVVWAISSYRAKTEEVYRKLRRRAELDLLHGRMNHVADKLGLPMVDLSDDIDAVLLAREERFAHLAGLDEYRPSVPQSGWDWWDSVALGSPSNTGRD
ncbi:hypothetical protein ACIGB6_13980 [Paeniglutamicibacter gangotriensis]|uniref:hypothetical protein n=1 Tax=Paeniglutamicibacter gangotriensis TaxID=254787 RepID=UPI0037C67ADD